MKPKKNRIMLIVIILLIIIVLLGSIIAYLYFFTDIFKSNKQLFFKYASQILQSEEGFIDNQLIQYFQKKNSNSYENNGKITFGISDAGIEQKLKLVNNFNISFSGKEDPNNLKSEKEISLNYSDDVKFPLTYRKINTITGLQTKYIGSNFVAIRNDEKNSNLKNINNILNLENIELSNEEIQYLKTTYFDKILNTLEDNKFSTLTEGDLKGYRLTLTNEDFRNILIKISNILKSDTNTTNKLSEMLPNIEIDILLDDLIENIKNLELNDNVEITVYTAQGNLSKIHMGMIGNTVTIKKDSNGQDTIYTINLNIGEQDISTIFTAKYAGLNSDNVNETYELILEKVYKETNIDEETKNTQDELTVSDKKETIDKISENKTINYTYKVTNNVQFKNEVKIESLTEENAVILNDKDSEYVTNLINIIQKRLVDVNKVQMEDLGVSENENPIQYLIPAFLVENLTNVEIDEEAVNTFNAKFELYQSTNTKGATVKGLLTTIQNNNETEGKNKIKEINMDGEEYEVTEQDIAFLKSSINVDDIYRVEFEKDIDTGLIYRAVINKR